MRIFIFCVLAIGLCVAGIACKRNRPSGGTTWTGIPAGSRTCANPAKWSTATTCITGGVAYVCIYDYTTDHNECARLSLEAPLEAPNPAR